MLQKIDIKFFLKKDTDFTKDIIWSLSLHLVIVLFFIFQFLFFSKPYVDLTDTIEVGFVDALPSEKLPEKIDQELSTAKEEVGATPNETENKIDTEQKSVVKNNESSVKPIVKDAEINLKKTKTLQKSAMDKIKKLNALDKIKQSVKAQAQSDKVLTKNSSRILAAGSPLSGLNKLTAENYLSFVDQKIKQNWTLPQWLINKPLKSQILVKLSATGAVIEAKVVTSSGNESYDRYGLQAIENSSPFQSVPEKLTEKFRIDGILIGFPD